MPIIFQYPIISGSSQEIHTVLTSVPKQNNNLIYNGTNQSVVWDDLVIGAYQVSGVTNAINAGTYSAIFSLNEGFIWPDNTTNDKIITWTINKAPSNLANIPTNDIYLSHNSLSYSFTLSKVGDGNIKVTGYDNSIINVSIQDTVVTITGIGNGTTNISISMSESENYMATQAQTFNVNVSLIGTLEDTDWNTISQISAEGTAASYWSIGDKKNITVDGVSCPLVLIGIYQDKQYLTFQLADVLPSRTFQFHSTTGVGWADSNLCNTAYNIYKNQLSSDLKSVIKRVSKQCQNPDGGATSTSYYIFILNEMEIYGEAKLTNDQTGTQYQYYSYGNPYKKSQIYWTRSPFSLNAFLIINPNMSNGKTVASPTSYHYLSFAFCV